MASDFFFLFQVTLLTHFITIHLKSHYIVVPFEESIRTSYFKSQCDELKESGQILPFHFFSTNLGLLHTGILLKKVFVRIEAECHDQLVIFLRGLHLVSNDGRQNNVLALPTTKRLRRMDSNEEKMFHTHSINISALQLTSLIIQLYSCLFETSSR